MSRLIRLWATSAALLILNPAHAKDLFGYSVTYRGVFSMGSDMAIAGVALSVGPVEPGGRLVPDGVRVPAWKVRFDGERILSDSTREPAHRALYVWCSKDDHRVPLRVDGRHAVGPFRVELANLDGVIRLAEVDR